MGRHRRRKNTATIGTVGELVAVLQAFDPDSDVRLATQPRLALEHLIDAVGEAGGTVWIGEGGHIGYAPEAASEALGWR